MNASFEEKSVWITLLALILAFGGYFFVAGHMLAAGVMLVGAYAAPFGVAVALLITVLVAAHIVTAIASRPDGQDERDRVIGWRAENNSSWILGAGVMVAIVALAFPIERVWVAHGLFATLFLAEVAKRLMQIYYYRWGE